MSGGAFDYIHSRIWQVASDVRDEAILHSKPVESEYSWRGEQIVYQAFDQSVIDAMALAAAIADLAARALKDVDWMISADTGPDTLVEQAEGWKKRLNQLAAGEIPPLDTSCGA